VKRLGDEPIVIALACDGSNLGIGPGTRGGGLGRAPDGDQPLVGGRARVRDDRRDGLRRAARHLADSAARAGHAGGFDAEVSSQMLGVFASLFGLLLAFVIVIEYQNFGNAQDNVGQEADSLAAITRDSDAFSPAQGDRIRGAIGTYVRAVVADEWPDLRQGHASARAAADVNAISVALLAAKPTSPQATAFYDDSVSQLNQASIAHRNRLSTAVGGAPSLVLTLILVGRS
jgi:hypothetical protein